MWPILVVTTARLILAWGVFFGVKIDGLWWVENILKRTITVTNLVMGAMVNGECRMAWGGQVRRPAIVKTVARLAIGELSLG